MNALKLTTYLFEKLTIDLPTFPGKRGKHTLFIKIGYRTAVYLNKKVPDVVAVRLQVSAKSKSRVDQPRLRLEASIVGIFKVLDRTKPVRSVAQKEGASIVYEILLEQTATVLDHAIAKGFQLPPKLPK